LALLLVFGLLLEEVPDDHEHLVGDRHQRVLLTQALCPTTEARGKDRLVFDVLRPTDLGSRRPTIPLVTPRFTAIERRLQIAGPHLCATCATALQGLDLRVAQQ
jgi:hypothetical protein